MTLQEIRDAVLASPQLLGFAHETVQIQEQARSMDNLVLFDPSTNTPVMEEPRDVPQPNTQAIADALSVGRTRVASITRAEFARWAAKTGMRAKIADHSANKDSPLRSSAFALMDVLNGASDTIDFSAADNIAMLDGWVQAQALTAEQHDSLLALATVGDPVPEFDVRCALLNDDGTLTV